MTVGRSGLALVGVALMAVTGCSGAAGSSDSGGAGSSSGKAAGQSSGQSAGGTATGTGSASAGLGTSQTVRIDGGTPVSDGAAQFDLPPGVAFVEAPPTVREDAAQRTWRYAPDPSSALCVVTLVQQARYTQPFPENERQLLRTRVEQVAGGKVLLDEAGPGPQGTASGWLTRHETPATPGSGRTQPVQVWTRTFLTQGRGLVQLAAAARQDQADTCRIEAVVRSLGFTGAEVITPTSTPTSPPGSTPGSTSSSTGGSA